MASLAATNQITSETSPSASSSAAAAAEVSNTAAAASTDQQQEQTEEDIHRRSVQIALDVKGISLALDLREGVLETLLVLLELPPFSMVKVGR